MNSLIEKIRLYNSQVEEAKILPPANFVELTDNEKSIQWDKRRRVIRTMSPTNPEFLKYKEEIAFLESMLFHEKK